MNVQIVRHALGKLKTITGPLWWPALLIFTAQRFGDVLNAVAGLWLVPQFVPQSDLGALEPLAKVGAMLGLPIAIIVTPYIKLLNRHATRGELGKVKAMLRDALLFCAAASGVTITAAVLLMPRIFEIVRVESGRLALLIIATSILGALTPIFDGTLRALKRFRTYSAISLIAAPARFVTLLLALPLRGLTGYFTGQASAPILSIGAASLDIFRRFGRNVKCEPYWRENRRLFLLILIPCVLSGATGTLRVTLEMMMIRSLPDIESAAFYHLSRFSEIASYVLNPLVFVLFPIISEKHERGLNTHRMLLQTMGFALATGAVLAVVFAVFGNRLFMLSPIWQPYAPYTRLLGIMTLLAAVRMAVTCFTTHEVACLRFTFLRYTVPLCLIESAIIYAAFRFPAQSGHGNWHLGAVLGFIFSFAVLQLVITLIWLLIRLRKPEHRGAGRAPRENDPPAHPA